jgi:hypothetical protein
VSQLITNRSFCYFIEARDDRQCMEHCMRRKHRSFETDMASVVLTDGPPTRAYIVVWRARASVDSVRGRRRNSSSRTGASRTPRGKRKRKRKSKSTRRGEDRPGQRGALVGTTAEGTWAEPASQAVNGSAARQQGVEADKSSMWRPRARAQRRVAWPCSCLSRTLESERCHERDETVARWSTRWAPGRVTAYLRRAGRCL